MSNKDLNRLQAMPSRQKVAYLVRQHRTAFSISQAELGNKAGMDQATIARIEAGTANISLTTLDRLAAAMHSQVDIRFRIN